MNIQKSMKIINVFLILTVLSSVLSCKKKGDVTYPTSTNYGENIFNIASGSVLTSGESYSFEADLTKNSTLRVKITNLSLQPTDPAIQKPRWVYDYFKGWKAGNNVDGVQEFQTQTIGNNDFKLVFLGTDGACKIETFLNGDVTPSITKMFTWK